MQTTRNISLIAIAVVVFVMIVWIAWSYFGSKVERPKILSVEQLTGNVQIWTVSPMIVATVKATGSQNEAIQDGFRKLAGYIFGDNTVSKPVAMTAPVSLKESESKTIAMTAPVALQKDGEVYDVSFMMPSEYTLETLPKPNDPDIQFVEVPSKKYYVWRFAGQATEARAKRQLDLFLAQLQESGIGVTNTPILNQYNDPWTIGFMRTNEWWIEL